MAKKSISDIRTQANRLKKNAIEQGNSELARRIQSISDRYVANIKNTASMQKLKAKAVERLRAGDDDGELDLIEQRQAKKFARSTYMGTNNG